LDRARGRGSTRRTARRSWPRSSCRGRRANSPRLGRRSNAARWPAASLVVHAYPWGACSALLSARGEPHRMVACACAVALHWWLRVDVPARRGAEGVPEEEGRWHVQHVLQEEVASRSVPHAARRCAACAHAAVRTPKRCVRPCALTAAPLERSRRVRVVRAPSLPHVPRLCTLQV
jgi:hypothetical protein